MLTTKIFIQRSIQKHGNKYDYSLSDYKGSTTKIKIKCNACENIWEALPHNHMQGRGCKSCQYKKLPQNQPLTNEEFIEKANLVHGNKFEYIQNYINDKIKIDIKCKKCNKIFSQRPGSHLSGIGCRNCQYKQLPQNQPLSINEFENQCQLIHNNRYQYHQDFKGGRYKIKIFCIKHQYNFMQNADAHRLKKQGCPRCNLSRGELKIEKYLVSNKINFETQKRFSDCKATFQLPFDFYLPNQNVCIEYDGQHHFRAVTCFGGEKRFEIVKQYDAIKTKFCLDKKIILIRIPFFAYKQTEAILTEKLC